MKAVVVRANLQEGVSTVWKVVGGENDLPALRNILVSAENNKIVLTATNLEVAMSFSLPGKVIDNGKVAVPAATLSGVVSNLPSERVNIEKKGGALEITSESYRAVVQGTSAEDFPIIPKVKNKAGSFEIKSDTLKEALRQAVVATEFSDLRPELNSVLFSFTGQEVKLVATDSFRLAERTLAGTQFSAESKQDARFLIPLKTSKELLRALKDGGVVRMCYDESQVFFTAGQLELISRLVEGNFPAYESVIPRKFDTEVVVERESFLNALKLASVFNARTNEVKFVVREDKRSVEISSAEQGIGENAYILPARVSGVAQEAIFNGRYIYDALQVLRGNEVFWGISKDNAPALFRDALSSSYIYIVKPILKT